ncbi:UNVERIFIED_CONTAM: hypothetical protein Sangu_3089200 [Sesamum angustifolium]|uniref:Uncharacterized protein n=1 Tax=Sesamum angustifolium TaxID=2727405 RepID=A0AAW2K6X2_9LAMI
MCAVMFYEGRGAAKGTSILPEGLTLRTGGVMQRAAYPREALSELHDVDNGGHLVGPHFAAKNQPFRVRSDLFSVVHVRWAKSAPWALLSPSGPGALESHGECGSGWESAQRK